VQIDFTRLLLLLRAKIVNGDSYWGVRSRGFSEKIFYKAWSWLVQDRQRYERFLKFASRTQRLLPRRNHQITRLPPPFSGWTKGRDLRPLAKAGFLAQQRKKH
jgi:L-lactate dehydrogenase complex protein LldF